MPYSVDLRAIQAPLKDRYRSAPHSALVTTSARSVASDPSDPRHCAVTPTAHPAVVIRSGLHPAAGGSGDVPCSGDILAAALVICEESTLRSVAANMNIEIASVEVEVDIHWDFRGTMGVDRTIPIGATGIDVRTRVRVKHDVDEDRARRLLGSAEHFCSTLQTL